MPPSVTELSAPPLSSPSPPHPSPSNLLRECLDLVSGDLRATEVELRGLLDSAVTVIPEIGAYLRSFNRDGLPFYAFYPAGGRDPVVLPPVLTEAIVVGELERASNSASIAPQSSQ